MYSPTDRDAIAASLETIHAAETTAVGTHRVAPHRLASLLIALALGDLFTTPRNSKHDHRQLFSAASALITIPTNHYMVNHSLAAVETLHMMVTYLFTTGRPDAAKAAWPLLGACVRLACAVGLHRDSGKWGLSGKEREKRDRLWWECMTYDML